MNLTILCVSVRSIVKATTDKQPLIHHSSLAGDTFWPVLFCWSFHSTHPVVVDHLVIGGNGSITSGEVCLQNLGLLVPIKTTDDHSCKSLI